MSLELVTSPIFRLIVVFATVANVRGTGTVIVAKGVCPTSQGPVPVPPVVRRRPAHVEMMRVLIVERIKLEFQLLIRTIIFLIRLDFSPFASS